jgi:hypothetical protein
VVLKTWINISLWKEILGHQKEALTDSDSSSSSSDPTMKPSMSLGSSSSLFWSRKYRARPG